MIKNTKTLIDFFLDNYIKDVNYAVDMTCGNGKDSLTIIQKYHPIKLYAFDIQKQAEDNTRILFEKNKINTNAFKFILDSHANIDKYVNFPIDLAIYNLGYLPKGDHNLTTNYIEVKESLEKLLPKLSEKGHIIISFYPGHPQGKLEATLLTEYLSKLDQTAYNILRFDFINQRNNPPFCVLIERV